MLLPLVREFSKQTKPRETTSKQYKTQPLKQRNLRGGHVILNGNMMAFSESGDLNKLAQWLEVGDSIEWMGMEYDNKFHLEAVRVTKSNRNLRPLCQCGTRMKSMGTNQGVRCPKCKQKSNQQWSIENREPPITWMGSTTGRQKKTSRKIITLIP